MACGEVCISGGIKIQKTREAREIFAKSGIFFMFFNEFFMYFSHSCVVRCILRLAALERRQNSQSNVESPVFGAAHTAENR